MYKEERKELTENNLQSYRATLSCSKEDVGIYALNLLAVIFCYIFTEK